MRNGRVRDRIDHLRPLLDDPVGLEVLADHETGDVLEEHERDVDVVAELDEMCGLLGRIGVDHAVVAQHTHRIAVDRRPATDHRGAVTRLELFEPGTVDDATDDLADLERLAEVLADESEEFFGIERRRIGLQRRRRIGLVPVEVRHDFATQTDGVHLVVSEVLGQAGDLGVLCAPPIVSESAISPVAIFTSGGPARKA